MDFRMLKNIQCGGGNSHIQLLTNLSLCNNRATDIPRSRNEEHPVLFNGP